jgi:alkanesulfonate monooxygenase SsuD/methylene tetrahydromethanopterin reductase-like flavin-dependent oxidoreductase (luciferase family)
MIGALSCATAPAVPPAAEETGPEVVGLLSRAEIETAVPDWIGAQIEARPDVEQAAEMAGAGSLETRVTVYLGTWCSDSRRELSRFWRAIDEAGGEVAFELAYVGVNRDKDEPADRLAGLGLQYVPTFVVEIGGTETGRIVEQSPNGIEHDLAALLQGRATGLITAKEELLRP